MNKRFEIEAFGIIDKCTRIMNDDKTLLRKLIKQKDKKIEELFNKNKKKLDILQDDLRKHLISLKKTNILLTKDQNKPIVKNQKSAKSNQIKKFEIKLKQKNNTDKENIVEVLKLEINANRRSKTESDIPDCELIENLICTEKIISKPEISNTISLIPQTVQEEIEDEINSNSSLLKINHNEYDKNNEIIDKKTNIEIQENNDYLIRNEIQNYQHPYLLQDYPENENTDHFHYNKIENFYSIPNINNNIEKEIEGNFNSCSTSNVEQESIVCEKEIIAKTCSNDFEQDFAIYCYENINSVKKKESDRKSQNYDVKITLNEYLMHVQAEEIFDEVFGDCKLRKIRRNLFNVKINNFLQKRNIVEIGDNEIFDFFDKCDIDKNGWVDINELGLTLQLICFSSRQYEPIKNFILFFKNDIDFTLSGYEVISILNQFIVVKFGIEESQTIKQKILNLFKTIDKEDNGYVTYWDLYLNKNNSEFQKLCDFVQSCEMLFSLTQKICNF